MIPLIYRDAIAKFHTNDFLQYNLDLDYLKCGWDI